MTALEQLLAERTQLALEQWPHLDRVWGCANCEILFAQPVNHRCPCCGSQSVLDLSVGLGAGHAAGTSHEVVEKMATMIELIDRTVGE